jgi:hypothetical protein
VEEIKAGRSPYLFVEIMACPNGCIGGGGQPRTKGDYQAYREERRQAVYALDRSNTIRQSHNNPMIKRIYEDFLEKPLSSKSHHLLHTSYSNKKKKVIHTRKEIWEENSGYLKLDSPRRGTGTEMDIGARPSGIRIQSHLAGRSWFSGFSPLFIYRASRGKLR